MLYAYGQMPLVEKTAKQCNFQTRGGKRHRFIRGFYGLTMIPTKFRKAMDKESAELLNTYVFLDDILIVTNGPLEKHYEAV